MALQLNDGTYVWHGGVALPIKPEHGFWLGIKSIGLDDLKDGTIFGKWTDCDNIAHLDLSVWLEDQQTAENIGRFLGEKAIWDIKADKAIFLTD